MRVFCPDEETELMRAGKMAPELTCMTYESCDTDTGFRTGPKIVDRFGAYGVFKQALEDKGLIIVGQNIAYDMGVLCAEYSDLVPLVFRAYKDNRITDTKIRQQLIDIANGCYRGYLDNEEVWHKYGYSLFDLVLRHFGRLLKKDGWRLRYGAFRDVPLALWPEKAKELQAEARELLLREAYKPEAERYYDGHAAKDLLAILEDAPEQVVKYPLDDASTTLDVFLAQETPENQAALSNQFRETYAAFALHLSSTWGIRTNAEGVDALERATRAALVEVQGRLEAEGLVRKDGSRDTKKAAAYMQIVCEREELPLRRTKKGGICLDKDACEATDDALLMAYSEFTQLGKTENADIPMLRAGTLYPVHCRYDLAETSRTTCARPNLQNLRKLFGIRECFTPRPGRVFIAADFPQLELYTLAECCYTWLGHSALGDMLKSGIDPHTAFAATLMGISYEEGLALKKSGDKDFYRFRQVSKAFNFGKPGGLGPKKLVALAASAAYRVTITEHEAKRYGRTWLETFPEMREYFERVNGLLGADGTATVVIPNTGFIRGGARYCAACNTGFQGLGAACAKSAMCEVAEAQYAQPESPLYGTRTVAMVHDEIIGECEEARCHEGAFELSRLMVVGANKFLPHCPIAQEKVEPLAMRQWSKEAEQVFENGRLVPWDIGMLEAA